MAPDLHALLSETLEMLRYYRSRIHAAGESEDGGISAYHNVYGVHHRAMSRADEILFRSKEWGLLRPLDQREEFHS